VVGVDFTWGMLDQAQKRITDQGWENVAVLQGDASRLPVAPPVDAVLATFVVGMLDDPSRVVEQWIELLAPEGRIALLDAAPRDENGPLDAAFRAFVVASAPPSTRFRYEKSPASVLNQRVEYAHHTLTSRASDSCRESLAHRFVRLTAGQKA
jgi:ubiquinone/menaquinone biosynthesis C-methylase UbiE